MADVVEVWSCGGGTQSGAMATLIKLGKLPRPDYAFMIDTGREKSSTWPFVNGFIRPQLASMGLELTIVKAADFTDHLDVIYTSRTGEQTMLLPGFTVVNGSVGKLASFCSGKWKREVAERWMRSIGIQKARNWIGISRDEARRIRAQHRAWLELWYPLIFAVPMTRQRCVELIRSQGWTGPIPHSACWMCPNQSDAEWLDMKTNQPGDFVAACELEDQARVDDSHFYLHPSCVPLRAKWVESNWPPPAGKLTNFQAKVMDILGMVGGGIYNAPIAWRTVQWVHGRNGLSLIWKDRNGLSTFDFDELTKLVFLCHEARIRCCVDPGGPHMFRLSFWPRVHEGEIYARHPNLDEAVAAFRAYLPSNHRIIYKAEGQSK